MRSGATAALLIASLAVLSIGAVAGQASTPSKVTIRLSDDGTAIEGRVKSNSARCEKSRKVKLGSKERGFYRKDGRTDDSGHYRLEGPGGPMPPARYFVSAFNKRGCPHAKSKTFEVE